MYDFFPKAKTLEEQGAQDFVVEQLKKKFLILAKEERYPKTPEVTNELDFILNTIKEFERENIENIENISNSQ
jgi:hypothetical protein